MGGEGFGEYSLSTSPHSILEPWIKGRRSSGKRKVRKGVTADEQTAIKKQKKSGRMGQPRVNRRDNMSGNVESTEKEAVKGNKERSSRE